MSEGSEISEGGHEGTGTAVCAESMQAKRFELLERQ